MTASEILDKYASGCPFTAHPKAPTPFARDYDRYLAVFGSKNKIREEWIAADMEKKKNNGEASERFFSAILYDTELAPITTNLNQLAQIGISIPPANIIESLDEDDVHTLLWDTIYGLATLGVFLVGTNGMDDRTLMLHLRNRVLLDEIRDIPPTPDMNEFINLDCPIIPDDTDDTDDDNDEERPLTRDDLLPVPRRFIAD